MPIIQVRDNAILEQFVQKLLHGRTTSTLPLAHHESAMPWLSGDNHTRRRYSRASSGSQKPLSQSPAVNLSTSPSQAKKNSNASEAKLRPLNRTKGKSTSSTASLSPTASKPNQDHATEVQHKPELGVFAYMEDDDEEAENRRIEDEHGDDGPNSSGSNTMASSPVSTHHPNSHYSDLEVNADPEFKRQTWHGGFDPVDSFNSDSGVSMGSSSGEGDSPIFQHKYPSIRRVSRLSASSLEPSIPEHYGLNVSPEPFTAQTPNLGSDPWPQDNPETYYRSAKYHPPENIAPVCQMPVTPPELSPQLPRTKNKAPASDFSKRQGYARLASTISSHDDAVLKPIYRKFDTLNNRILLYLQDEISELEAELEELDEGIARELHYLGKNHRQASRRAEARAPSALQMRRIELMGRCAGKIDIYSK